MENRMPDTFEPGVQYFYPVADYHRDPCPEPSLSSTSAKTVINECLHKAWLQHPRYGGMGTEQDDRMSLGTAAHTLLFERGQGLVEVKANDWRTNAAKDQRQEILSQGKTPILSKHMQLAADMAQAITDQLAMHHLAPVFFGEEMTGWSKSDEVALFWREVIDGRPIWCRNLLDRLCISKNRWVIFDLKTTERSVAPHGLAAYAAGQGHDIQAAMAVRGLQNLISTPITDRLEFYYVYAETEPPHLVTVGKVSQAMLVLGSKKVAQAMALWSRAQKDNNFPGYPRTSVELLPPPYAETAWLNRELNDPGLVATDNDPFLTASPWVPHNPETGELLKQTEQE